MEVFSEMTKKIEYRRCRVCEEKIKIEFRRGRSINRNIKYGSSSARSKQFVDSKEGVFFNYSNLTEGGVWFCNLCWKEILEYGNKRN